MGDVREARDIAMDLLDLRIVALLKREKTRDIAQAQFAGLGEQIVDQLFHGVTDEDQRLDLARLSLAARMREHLADLGSRPYGIRSFASCQASSRGLDVKREAQHSFDPR